MTDRELKHFYPVWMVHLLRHLAKKGKCPHPVATVTPFHWRLDRAKPTELTCGHICEVCLGKVEVRKCEKHDQAGKGKRK